MRSLLGLMVAISLVAGCGDSSKSGDDNPVDADWDGTSAPIEGDEAGECSDEADNDGDGLFDCNDPDCFGSPACREDTDPCW